MTFLGAEVQTFVRSFFLQALWNFDAHGKRRRFCVQHGTALKSARTGRKNPSFMHALRRHTGYFNTHPYFCPHRDGRHVSRKKKKWPRPNAAKIRR